MTADIVKKCVSEIKVIPENRDGSAEFDEASYLICNAAAVHFLGFGYNPTNVKRLKIPESSLFYGTAFDLKADERRRARQLFLHAFGGGATRDIKLGQENEDTLLFLRSYPVFD